VPSKGSLNGGRTVSTILLRLSDLYLPASSPSSGLVSHRHGHKGFVHASTSVGIDSVTSAVITNGLRRKSNEWIFYEFRGDSPRKEGKNEKRPGREDDRDGGERERERGGGEAGPMCHGPLCDDRPSVVRGPNY